MRSNKSIPLPPTHSPRLGLEQEQPQVKPQQSTSNGLLAILKRRRVKVTPTESNPSLEEKAGVLSYQPKMPYQTTQIARSPAGEFKRLAENLNHGHGILINTRYNEYKVDIKTSIDFLIMNSMCTLENQAAVIMARENTALVAQSLKKLHDQNIIISNNMQLALLGAGKNVEYFVSFLIASKKYLFPSKININALAAIFSSVNNNTATKLTKLLSDNVSSIIALTKGFSEMPVTSELVDFVSDSLRTSTTTRVKDIFTGIKASVSEQSAPAPKIAKRSKSLASASRMFQDGSTDHSDSNPNPLKKAATHQSTKFHSI